jgi:hypothetical protein
VPLIDTEIQQRSQPLRFDDAVGELPLDRNRLEIGSRFLKHKRHVGAVDRDGDDCGGGRLVEERETGSFTANPTALELEDIGCGRRLHEADHFLPPLVFYRNQHSVILTLCQDEHWAPPGVEAVCLLPRLRSKQPDVAPK